MEETESEREKAIFYEKVAAYVNRHPEFVEDLQRRIEDEEKEYGSGREKKNDDRKKKSIFVLDEDKVNRISEEISGMLFDRDKSSKSVLEKTVEDAFSGMVKKYLSKYM